MKIGYRTIKTAIGTPLSVTIAQLLGLTNFVSAGILTILCIQPSRKRSFFSAWHRFLACIVASIFSLVFFELLGYHPLVLCLMLGLFIPTTVLLKVTPGISTSSVVILNLYSSSHITVTSLVDQYLLIIVGIGTGLLLNLYMPSLDKTIKDKQQKLEENFRVILFEYSRYIRYKDTSWNGKEITESEDILTDAIHLVERDRENHLLRNKHPYRDYFYMRISQYELLKQMLPLVTNLPNSDTISQKIADFFEGLSDSVHPGNTAILFLDELKELREEFNKVELPATREEFETRANLFQLLHEIEDYLIIKQKFKKSDVNLSLKDNKIKDRL
ncbi:aromatic acid exporter family protein [Oceanobacillus massiliensis]|uniref:aromatic acid exporter family protein n=1 Tax=Oceanobacillus massiliensis TaxID=1465765 RepID=UPI0002889B05|nr:aromatic acid exporter family protein [Oceanobacillus massiliensis]